MNFLFVCACTNKDVLEFLLIELACLVTVPHFERNAYDGATCMLRHEPGLADGLLLGRDSTSGDLRTRWSYPALKHTGEPVLGDGGTPFSCHARAGAGRRLRMSEVFLFGRSFGFVILVELLKVG